MNSTTYDWEILSHSFFHLNHKNSMNMLCFSQFMGLSVMTPPHPGFGSSVVCL